MPAKPEEVKNFDIESRIREIIAENLEPVLRREAEDREDILKLMRNTEKHKKQLEDLEFYTKTADKRMLQIDDINKRIWNSDSERRVNEADISRRFNEFEGRFENLCMEVDRAIKLLKQIEDRNAFLDKELNAIHGVITAHKDSIAKTVRDLLSRVEYNCSDLVRASAKAESAARESSQRLAEMLKLGPQLTSQVETMKKIVSDCEFEVTRMKRNKLEEKDLIPHRKEWQLEVGKLKEAVYHEEIKRSAIENFIDKYMPMSVQAIISDNMHASLDNKSLTRFIQFEIPKIAELKNLVSERKVPIDELKSLIREAATKVEIRAAQPQFREESAEVKKRERRHHSSSSESEESSEYYEDTAKTKKRRARRKKVQRYESSEEEEDYEEQEEEEREKISSRRGKFQEESDNFEDMVAEAKRAYGMEERAYGMEAREIGMELQMQENLASPSGNTVKSTPSGRSRRTTSRKSSKGPSIGNFEFNFDQLSEATPKSAMSKTQKFTGEEGQESNLPGELVEGASEAESVYTRQSVRESTQQGQVSRPISEASNEALSSENPSPDLIQMTAKKAMNIRRLKKNLTSYGGDTDRGIMKLIELQLSEEEVAELKGIAEEFYSFKTELQLAFDQKTSSLLDLQAKGFEELKTYVGMIQTELETATRLHKRERSEWKSKVINFESLLNQAGDEVNRRAQEVRHMSQMIACLAEFNLISNSLMQQDEVDREAIQLTGYRDVTKTDTSKQVITMSTDCVSCSGQSSGLVAAFKMACLSYNPSQLNYRHRKFTRQQLLHVQAAMLQGCWNELKQHTPFIGSDFAPTFEEPISVKATRKKTGMLDTMTPKTKPKHVRLDALNSTQ
mmetsp:Transcript_18979/g.34409  ORF Transcript_18979/g.34409 Transcript_18979/m.34409 type:complete len:849 (-) Transcript_18979:3111-5657(-)|eukprot:CAMPEP_0204901184 /NCGR_PEP_ID=MMETSP1397-20131031/2928_1 /ASSEMBLY_ACC=CAM_ASM_000891 /TAXON_ID=49980 /ORGANISM="Climacostomum Climacostomum virens, Strain Stock W-24" /LENGTH=848 /DNA_ID=CAMNT_0052069491 /DNA_START=1629 /DNA_END=4175 /DNA_ORIENTATION=+